MSIFTAMPLYARSAVAMLADTVGASTGAPTLRLSTSISPSDRRKKVRVRGSRMSSAVPEEEGSGSLVQKVSGGPEIRGAGALASSHSASSSVALRQAWGDPTGRRPHSSGASRYERPSTTTSGLPRST